MSWLKSPERWKKKKKASNKSSRVSLEAFLIKFTFFRKVARRASRAWNTNEWDATQRETSTCLCRQKGVGLLLYLYKHNLQRYTYSLSCYTPTHSRVKKKRSKIQNFILYPTGIRHNNGKVKKKKGKILFYDFLNEKNEEKFEKWHQLALSCWGY